MDRRGIMRKTQDGKEACLFSVLMFCVWEDSESNYSAILL